MDLINTKAAKTNQQILKFFPVNHSRFRKKEKIENYFPLQD